MEAFSAALSRSDNMPGRESWNKVTWAVVGWVADLVEVDCRSWQDVAPRQA